MVLIFPGIDKSGKVVVHIKGNTPYLRVAFRKEVSATWEVPPKDKR